MFSEWRSQDFITLTFNLTWHCPVKCPYCYRALSSDRGKSKILSEQDLIRECQIASQHGITEYRFSGGEPVSVGDRLFEYADIVCNITGHKPILMTSGWGIDDEWLKRAVNRFSAIAVSIENPLNPLQTVIDNSRILELIRENTSTELPLVYGLTLVTAEEFKNVERIFNILYENVDHKFMPQLDYTCLSSFLQPTRTQLKDIENSTKSLFREHGPIPYYFVYLVGSLTWLAQDAIRIVLNLHPEGNYQIYDSLLERWQVEYRWKNYLFDQQQNSDICRKCQWIDSCRHHPLWDIRYDWCNLRRSIFRGIYEGLRVGQSSI